MKDPKRFMSGMLFSVPFMIINTLVSMGIIYFFSSFSFNNSIFTGDSITITIDVGLLISMLLVIIIHEFFHLIFIPNFLRSKDLIIGLTFLGAYVHTEIALTKARFMLISIAPYVILSILLPLILSISGLLSSEIIVFIILNSLGSSLDILGLVLVFLQVPKNAVIRNNGIMTYWKLEK